MAAINLIAVNEARPDTVAEVKAHLDEYAKHVLSMDGSERFEVYIDKEVPTRVVVIEQYRDEAAFAEHIADPENAVLNGKTLPLLESEVSLQFLV